ncbi:MAG TPA: hypothetical protein VJ806_06860 [Luteimonas sp.]|nr:hypothetical protein [Luteimonas sp.]
MLQGLPPLTLLHVAISLVGIFSGLIVLFHGLLASRRLSGWTSLFLWSTVATSLSGFILPATRFLPSHATGIVSMIALAVAIPALYKFRLAGGWRRAYVVSAVAALYFNVFVLVVQLFLKVPALKALAPTQKEPPFLIAQGAVLLAFAVLGFLAVRRFRPAPAAPAAAGAAALP